MTRTLSWTVGDDMSLSPHGVQDAGVQGDHNATVIEFAIPEDDFGGKTMYIELTDSTGGYDKTDALTPENHKVSFPLPLAWTQAGGEATVRLVVTDGEDGEDTETAYSFAGRIRFDTRTVSHTVDSLIKGAIHWLMEKAASVLTSAETAATTATAKAAIATSAAAGATTAAGNAAQSASEAAGSASTASNAASGASHYADLAAASAASAEASAQEIKSGNYAKTDGYYGGMTVGTAENLIDTKAVGTSRTFSFDTACGDASITDDGTGTIAELSGNTILWNQIADCSAPAARAVNGVRATASGGVISLSGTATASYSNFLASHYVYHSHRYFVSLKVLSNPNNVYFKFGALNAGGGVVASTDLPQDISTCFGVDRDSGFGISGYTAGTSFDGVSFVGFVCDLTAMFGAGNEPTTAAEFAAMFPRDYYAYTGGTLLDFRGTGLKTVGFNAFRNGTAELLGGHDYQITGAYTALTLNGKTVTPSPSGAFTPAGSGTLTVTGWDDTTCVHLVWSGYRNGEFEEYWENTLSLPVAQYFPSGMKSAGAVHDSLFADKAVTRVGTRAYRSGDEADPTVTTDGTHTNYALATPVTVSIAPPLNLHYKVADFGTEKLLPENGAEPTTSPFVGTVRYSADYPREIANLPRNFLGTASLDSLLTVLGTQLHGTFTRTYNSAAGRYDFAFTSGS